MMALNAKPNKYQGGPKDTPVTLTPRQVQILQFIRDYRSNNGCSPTLTELAQQLRVSKVTVFEHVEALVRKGVLYRQPHRARSLTLDPSVESLLPVSTSDDVASICEPIDPDAGDTFPLAGVIAAGVPLEAVEDRDCLELGSLFQTPAGTFALQVRGDSMIDEHIRDGDYVMVAQATQARDGQIVVAVLENGEATLKKFYRQGRGVRLEPANPAFEPLYVDQVNIQGIVIGVIRRY